MDLTTFRDNVRKRIEDRANRAINKLGQVRWHAPGMVAPAGETTGGVVMPSLTIEDIALAHTMYQAEAQVLTEAIAMVDEEFRKAMGQPAEAHDPVKDAALAKQENQRKKGGVY